MNYQWNYQPGQVPPRPQQQSWQQGYQQQQYMLQQPQGVGVVYPMAMGGDYPVPPGGPMYQPHPMGGQYMYYQQPHFQTVLPGQVPLAQAQPTQLQDQAKLYEEEQRKMAERVRPQELEEQKRIEMEKQKRRLESVNITNPPSSISSLETLIGFDPKANTSSVKPPKVTKTSSTPPIEATPPKPTPPPVAAPTTTKPIVPTGPSIDELLVNSMSKIDQTVKRPIQKSDFKTTLLKNSPTPQPRVFTESSKARAWDSSVTNELTGLFQVEEPAATSNSDDNFGEFQSVEYTQKHSLIPVTHMATPPTGSPQLVYSSQGRTPLMATGNSFNNTDTVLPLWLISGAPLPNIYYSVYQKCYIEGTELTNTQVLFPILVSSGLDRGILCDLWTISNQTISGQLTKIELFVILGLIGLSQTRGTPVSLADLKSTNTPPSPQLSALSTNIPPAPLLSGLSTNDEFGDFQGTTASSVLPYPSLPTTTSDDKYSVFKDFSTPSPQPLLPKVDIPQGTSSLPPVSSTSDDKYSVFKDFSTPSPQPLLLTNVPSSTQNNFTSANQMSNTQNSTTDFNNSPQSPGWADFTSFTATSASNDNEFVWNEVVTVSSSNGSSSTSKLVSPPPIASPTSSVSDEVLSYSNIWHQCLTKCQSLLKQFLTVLLEEKDKEVFKELATIEAGKDQLKGVFEVYRFAKRIHTSSRGPGKQYMTPSKNESLTKMMLEIKETWNSISDLLPSKEMSQIQESSSSLSLLTDEDINKCQLCLLPSHIFISPLVTIDGCSERYTLSTGSLNGRIFHVQCANFWSKGMELGINLIP